MSNPKIDFVFSCATCGNWCCSGENPFASEEELRALGVSQLIHGANRRCSFLNEQNLCSSYEKRPFECRIFPHDILEIEGKLVWVLWNTCRADLKVDSEEYLAQLESDMKQKYNLDYVQAYVRFHKQHQPVKYADFNFNVLREVNWQRDLITA